MGSRKEHFYRLLYPPYIILRAWNREQAREYLRKHYGLSTYRLDIALVRVDEGIGDDDLVNVDLIESETL